MDNQPHLHRSIATPDLEAQAESWDGPHFRLANCGINHFRVSPPAHAMFMDAMEAAGCWEYVLSGRIYYRLGERVYPVETGEALVARRPDPGWMLRPVEDAPVQTLWVGVKGEPALRMFDYLHTTYGQIQKLPLNDRAVALARQLVRLVQKQPLRQAAFWSEKTFEWMNAWWQCLEQGRREHPHASLPAVAASRLLSYAPKTVTRFAAEMGYSRAYLTRKLTQQWKRSPGVVLRETRLQDAARLLRTSRLSVGEVAGRVGYVSAAAFCRAFAKQYGDSPQHYRLQCR